MSINQERAEHGPCMAQFIRILLIAFQRPLYPIKIILRRPPRLWGQWGTPKQPGHIYHLQKQTGIGFYLSYAAKPPLSSSPGI